MIQVKIFTSNKPSSLELNVNYFLEHDKTIDSVKDIKYYATESNLFTAMVMYYVKEDDENGCNDGI